ncbi:MAG: LTA synthase family protein [Bacteroidetes bacterium]|nr:LTA synthase family protein [Bacteroidota bacterium]
MQKRVSEVKNWKNNPIAIVIKLYILSLSIFFIYRAVLFFTELDRIDFAVDELSDIISAFVFGLRFDIVISGYILLLPILFLFVLDIFKYKSKITSLIMFGFIFTLFSLSFIIAAADIPYFNQFFSRITIDAFQWIDSPLIVVKMILQESKHFLFLILTIILIYVYYKFSKNILDNRTIYKIKTSLKIPLYLLLLLVMFLGIRGRIGVKSPIRVGTAYFCNNAFLNQLGLNPVFTLMTSYLESKKSAINIMNSDLAEKNVQEYLKISKQNLGSPIARLIKPDSVSLQMPNVVIVLMESMSAAKMKRGGNPNKLTPFLDSLSYNSIYFDNFYTSGRHTFNGIFSTLFSFPAIYSEHTMKRLRKYNGISNALKKYDYQTIYFTTHDGQFDNVEAFLLDNDFDRVVSQKDFPFSELKTAFGVTDDYLFRFSIPFLNKLESNSKPFLSVFMTVSDHIPYYIPEYFNPTADDEKQQIVQYADWSIKQFMKEASKQKWFNNTIFVFLADHGVPMKAEYAMSLDYHHSPLIIYPPGNLNISHQKSCIASQIDVFPTIMGLLKLPYINNTLGIDLLNDSRKYVIINGDNKIGVLDNEYLLIIRKNEKMQLHKYKIHDMSNYYDEMTDKAKEMEEYAKSNMQVYLDLMTRNQTFIKN